eukprot:g50937.t1
MSVTGAIYGSAACALVSWGLLAVTTADMCGRFAFHKERKRKSEMFDKSMLQVRGLLMGCITLCITMVLVMASADRSSLCNGLAKTSGFLFFLSCSVFNWFLLLRVEGANMLLSLAGARHLKLRLFVRFLTVLNLIVVLHAVLSVVDLTAAVQSTWAAHDVCVLTHLHLAFSITLTVVYSLLGGGLLALFVFQLKLSTGSKFYPILRRNFYASLYSLSVTFLFFIYLIVSEQLDHDVMRFYTFYTLAPIVLLLSGCGGFWCSSTKIYGKDGEYSLHYSLASNSQANSRQQPRSVANSVSSHHENSPNHSLQCSVLAIPSASNMPQQSHSRSQSSQSYYYMPQQSTQTSPLPPAGLLQSDSVGEGIMLKHSPQSQPSEMDLHLHNDQPDLPSGHPSPRSPNQPVEQSTTQQVEHSVVMSVSLDKVINMGAQTLAQEDDVEVRLNFRDSKELKTDLSLKTTQQAIPEMQQAIPEMEAEDEDSDSSMEDFPGLPFQESAAEATSMILAQRLKRMGNNASPHSSPKSSAKTGRLKLSPNQPNQPYDNFSLRDTSPIASPSPEDLVPKDISPVDMSPQDFGPKDFVPKPDRLSPTKPKENAFNRKKLSIETRPSPATLAGLALNNKETATMLKERGVIPLESPERSPSHAASGAKNKEFEPISAAQVVEMKTSSMMHADRSPRMQVPDKIGEESEENFSGQNAMDDLPPYKLDIPFRGSALGLSKHLLPPIKASPPRLKETKQPMHFDLEPEPEQPLRDPSADTVEKGDGSDSDSDLEDFPGLAPQAGHVAALGISMLLSPPSPDSDKEEQVNLNGSGSQRNLERGSLRNLLGTRGSSPTAENITSLKGTLCPEVSPDALGMVRAAQLLAETKSPSWVSLSSEHPAVGSALQTHVLAPTPILTAVDGTLCTERAAQVINH